MSARRPAKALQTPDSARVALVLGGGSLLTQVGRALNTALDRAFAELDLTAQQAALLMHAHKSDSSPTQLMARLGTDTAGMTKLIDRLEAKGLLARRRSTTDRRSVLVEVTSTGEQIAPQIPIIFGKITRQLFNGFTTSEVEAVTDLLERMHANLSSSPRDGTN